MLGAVDKTKRRRERTSLCYGCGLVELIGPPRLCGTCKMVLERDGMLDIDGIRIVVTTK